MLLKLRIPNFQITRSLLVKPGSAGGKTRGHNVTLVYTSASETEFRLPRLFYSSN